MTMRFVLVHGGMHTGAHFDLLSAELRALGHDVVAPDLPGRGERAEEKATWDGCRVAVADTIQEGDVLVSHSAGGYSAALAAEVKAPLLRRLIFLAASVPVDGQTMGLASLVEQGHPMFVPVEGRTGPEIAIQSFEMAWDSLYQDCNEQVARHAFAQLVPEQVGLMLEPFSLPSFDSLKIPRDYIVCLDDRSGINAKVENYSKMLGLSQVHPFWSSHSPFLSRPHDTAELLVRIVGS
jgi:pimeloyl-ACP methyl ester carboxylesterase